MVLIVDFNMREEDGRIPALLVAGRAEAIAPGEKVLAADGEGTECWAVVSEISPDGRYAMLDPIGGSWRHDSKVQPSAHDLAPGGSHL